MARRHLPVLYVLTRVAFIFISSTIVTLITLLNSRNSFDDDNTVFRENHGMVQKFESSISIDEVNKKWQPYVQIYSYVIWVLLIN